MRPVTERPSFRAADARFVDANSEGRFELQLTPGKTMLGAGGVEVRHGDLKFSGPPTTEVSVTEGNVTEVDLPVEELQPTVHTNAQPKVGAQPSATPSAAQPAQPAAAASAQWPPVKLFRPRKPNSVRGIVADEKHAPMVGARSHYSASTPAAAIAR